MRPSRSASDDAPPMREAITPLVPQWSSTDLFKGSKEIAIQHNGAEYRLRVTAANKLILTK